MGISNKEVEKFFKQNNVNYIKYIDGDLFETKILKNIDFIIKSSGIKFDTNFLKIAESLKIKVISDLELFYLLFPNKEMILVTGTNGKTTTSILISSLLNDANIYKSGVYGNIGIPLFLLNDELVEVVEASSFMLHNSYKLKPHIYIVTSLVSHHLDYHQNEENYYYDKLKIINNLNEFDYLIYNKDYEIINEYLNNLKCNVITYSLSDKTADVYLKDNNIIFNNQPTINLSNNIRKEDHVLENMLATFIVGKIYNINNELIENSLINFKGVEHRFEFIVNNNNNVIINDSKSTSPMALSKAIDNIKKYENFFKIIILGGMIVDKNYDEVNEKIKLADEIYIFGKDNYKFVKYIKHNNIFVFDTLDEIIFYIKNKKRNKLLILFSPSCPSYDLYKNFEERGEHFKKLIFYHNFCK